jgi:hypothetical protein
MTPKRAIFVEGICCGSNDCREDHFIAKFLPLVKWLGRQTPTLMEVDLILRGAVSFCIIQVYKI